MYPKELSDLGCEKKTKDQYEQSIQINRKIDESVEQTLHKRRLQKTEKQKRRREGAKHRKLCLQ